MSTEWFSHVPWSVLGWVLALYVIWQLGKRLLWIGFLVMVAYYAVAIFK